MEHPILVLIGSNLLCAVVWFGAGMVLGQVRSLRAISRVWSKGVPSSKLEALGERLDILQELP